MASKIRGMKRAACVAPLLCAALAGAQAPRDGLATPALTGPHAVGRRVELWADSSRRDPMDTTRVRELMVWAWYPAPRTRAAQPEVALPGAWGDAHATETATRLGDAAASALKALRVHARTDAPVEAGGAAYPVVLFTPGLGWLPSDYSTLAEDLASHGYVVFAAAPTGLADVVRFPDGREVKRGLGIGERITTDQVHAHDDTRFVLQRVRRIANAPGSPYRGRLDLARIGAFGHSLGGTTSLVLAAGDTTIRAAINIDGDPMGTVLEARPRQPLLLISSESPPIEEAPANPDPRHVELVKAGLDRSELRRTGDWQRIAQSSASAQRIRVLGARHSNFSDLSLASPLITDPAKRWMRMGPIDGARSLRITSALVASFFDRTLRGAPAPLLDHPERTFRETRVESAAR